MLSEITMGFFCRFSTGDSSTIFLMCYRGVSLRVSSRIHLDFVSAILFGVSVGIFSHVLSGISPRDLETISPRISTGFIPRISISSQDSSSVFHGFSAAFHSGISSTGFFAASFLESLM